MTAPWWTTADAAELDVLLFEFARAYDEHRRACGACQPGECAELVSWRKHLEECRPCRGDAPLKYGPPCSRRQRFLNHGQHRVRCNPCPSVQLAIELVVEWREARELRSKAAYLRARRDRIEETAA